MSNKIKNGSIIAFITLTSLLLLLFMKPTSVKADINNISLTPLVSDNEDPDNYRISGDPGSTKTLRMSLTNFGDMDVKLKVRPTNATTSDEGKYEFTDHDFIGKYGLRYSFAKMTSGKMIFLKSQQTKTLTFKVKLPPEPMHGTVIGGFDVYDVKHPNDGHTGVGVYFDTMPTNNNHLIKFQDVTPEVHNQQPYLMVNLANYRAETMKDLIVQVKIKKNNWYNKLGINNQENVQDVKFSKVAPNSRIPLEFNQKQTPIQPGNYLVEGTAKNAQGTWHFKRNVKVDAEEAQEINQQSKNLIYDKTGLYLTIIAIMTMVIVLVFWGIAYQRR